MTARPAMLSLAALVPNRGNIREEIGDVTELAASIRVHGILQPLVVTPDARNPGKYLILAGHRRAAAAARAGLTDVPALIRSGNASRDEQIALMVVENCQRADLTPLEQTEALAALRQMGKSVTEIARMTGFTAHTVSRRLLLIDLPADAQRMVEDHELTLADAEQLARQVKRHRTGRVVKARSPQHLARTHALADDARRRCDLAGHPEPGRVGETACGRCWEDTIRADERGEIDHSTLGIDEAAVDRRVHGDLTVTLNNAERREVVRRLHAEGLSDNKIADRSGIDPRQVLRDRQRLQLPPNQPPSRGTAA